MFPWVPIYKQLREGARAEPVDMKMGGSFQILLNDASC